MKTEVVFTHRCPRGVGGTMISANPCRERLKLAASPGKMSELPATLRMRLEECNGCEGPEALAEPIPVEGFAAPGQPPKKPATQTEEKKPMANKTPPGLRSPEVRAKAAKSRRRNSEARKQAEAAQAMAGRLTPMLRSRRDDLASAIADPDLDGPELRTPALNLIAMLDAMGATGALPGWEAA